MRNLPVGTESLFSKNLSAAFPGKIKPTRLRDEKHRIQAYQGIKRKKIDPYRRFCETQLIEEANGETPDGKDELIPLLKSDSENPATSERDPDSCSDQGVQGGTLDTPG